MVIVMCAVKGLGKAKASYPPGRQGLQHWLVILSHGMDGDETLLSCGWYLVGICSRCFVLAGCVTAAGFDACSSAAQ
jgi:hypothetical protein